MKKVGKTNRSFRYNLNQIPYDYTVELMNRYKGLDLVDRVPAELWTKVHNTAQEATRGWCTGTTQRDGMGREEGGGFRMGNTCIPMADSF